MVCVWGWGERAVIKQTLGFGENQEVRIILSASGGSLLGWGQYSFLAHIAMVRKTFTEQWDLAETWRMNYHHVVEMGRRHLGREEDGKRQETGNTKDVYTGQWVGQAACDRVQRGDGGK